MLSKIFFISLSCSAIYYLTEYRKGRFNTRAAHQVTVYWYRMKKIFVLLLTTILLTGAIILLTSDDTTAPSDVAPTANIDIPDEIASTAEADIFDKEMFSINNAESPWVVVNKRRSIPTDYVPASLIVPNVPLRLSSSEEQMKISDAAQDAVEELFTASDQIGLELQFGSGYRSSTLQSQFYNSYSTASGSAEADRFSARPGHSEHQTGLGLDFTRIDGECHLQECFSDTAEGIWLSENAQRYGFLLRYPRDMESITGYIFEPWHYRYVGVELAEEIYSSNFSTLEQFFGLDPAPDYR